MMIEISNRKLNQVKSASYACHQALYSIPPPLPLIDSALSQSKAFPILPDILHGFPLFMNEWKFQVF